MPVIYVILLGHEERSHTLLWSFLILGDVREKVLHLRDRVDEVSSACFRGPSYVRNSDGRGLVLCPFDRANCCRQG